LRGSIETCRFWGETINRKEGGIKGQKPTGYTLRVSPTRKRRVECRKGENISEILKKSPSQDRVIHKDGKAGTAVLKKRKRIKAAAGRGGPPPKKKNIKSKKTLKINLQKRILVI